MTLFQHIRLELAREPGHPAGDRADGWDLVAPLDAESRLDREACRDAPERCYVRRFVRGETVATGRLRRGTGDQWWLDLDGGDELDAKGFRLGEERFVPGEYVSLISAGGDTHTYAVRQVVPVEGGSGASVAP
jgi:hypothetical protein